MQYATVYVCVAKQDKTKQFYLQIFIVFIYKITNLLFTTIHSKHIQHNVTYQK